MASPFSVFRKYQYVLLVVFGVVLMIAFVIAPPILDYQQARSRGNGTDSVVASWTGGTLRESDLQSLQLNRNLARAFVDALVQKTMAQNGYPRVPRVLNSNSEEDIVRTVLLAQQAEKAGIAVSDSAILEYLEQLTAELIPSGEIGDIFRQTLAERMSEPQLFGVLRTELLAQNFLMMMNPSLFLSRSETVPPHVSWQYHLRMQRRVKVELSPLEVSKFKAQLTVQPTQQQIESLYNEGKDRYPSVDWPDPGFRRRAKIAFEYVKADLDGFVEQELEAAKAAVTDKDVVEHYEKNKERYRILDLPPEQPEAKDEAKPGKPEVPAPAEKPAREASKQPTAASAVASPSTSQEGAGKVEAKGAEAKGAAAPAAKPQSPAPQAGESAQAGPPTEKASGAPAKPERTEPSKPGEVTKPPAVSAPAKDGQSSSEAAGEATFFVSLGAGEQTDAAPVAGQGVNPAADVSPKPPAAPPSPPAPAPQAASASPTKTKAESSAAAPGDAGVPAAQANSAEIQPAPAAEPKYKPLDDALRGEIREELARTRAREAAQARLQKAFAEVRREVESHAKAVKKGASLPDSWKLEEVAGKLSLTAGKIPLSDSVEVRKYDLGCAFEVVDFSWPPKRQYFTDVAYQDGTPAYRPAEIRGEKSNEYFLYWRVAEEQAYTPALQEIQATVVDAWKQRQALVLAKGEAARLAEVAGKSGKSLKEALGGDAQRSFIETNEFSWMSTGFTAASMNAPGLSNVEGVVGAGEDFMRAVFALETGKTGIAVNQPESTVYVVRIISESPGEEELKQKFLQSGHSFEIQQIAAMEGQRYVRQWYEDLEKSLNLKWQRPPAF